VPVIATKTLQSAKFWFLRGFSQKMQSDQELDDYLESRDGRGISRWFSNGKLEVSV